MFVYAWNNTDISGPLTSPRCFHGPLRESEDASALHEPTRSEFHIVQTGTLYKKSSD